MKITILATLTLAALSAQEIKLPASLDRLAAKATETVDVTLDSSLLQLAGRFLSDKDPDTAKMKRVVGGLKGIWVKSYQFEKAGEYLDSDVEALRSQVKGTEWHRIVGVQNRKNGELSEVYLKNDANQVGGLVVIAAEPKQLTFVVISGTVDPETLNDLAGQFGIPDTLNKGKKRKDKSKDEE